MRVCLLVSAMSENLALALSDVADAVETCKGRVATPPTPLLICRRLPNGKAGRI